MNKLKDMAHRVSAAYGELIKGKLEGSLTVNNNVEEDRWIFFRSAADHVPNKAPAYGRAVILLRNTVKADSIKTHPFRAVFVEDMSQKEGTAVSGLSLVYEPGEEEGIALSLYEFLIENKAYDDMTFDDLEDDHE